MEEKNIEDCRTNRLSGLYITYVWAEDQEGLIGRDGQLPWNLPNEMKHFVEVTTGDVVVMGRRTYESIPVRPLKNRVNIILTRDKTYEAPGAIVCHTKEDIMKAIEGLDKPIHIIGGTSLFEMFIDEVDVLHRTVVEETFEGDTYMPKIDYKYFRVVDSKDGIVDEENIYPHRFYVYERKNLAKPFDS